MRRDNCNVGIGTTSPITELDIRKSGGARLRLENSNTSHSFAHQDESIEFCTDYATTGFIHQKGEDMRIGVTGGRLAHYVFIPIIILVILKQIQTR